MPLVLNINWELDSRRNNDRKLLPQSICIVINEGPPLTERMGVRNILCAKYQILFGNLPCSVPDRHGGGSSCTDQNIVWNGPKNVNSECSIQQSFAPFLLFGVTVMSLTANHLVLENSNLSVIHIRKHILESKLKGKLLLIGETAFEIN